MAEKHVEVTVSKEVIDRAIAEITPNLDKIGLRGGFNGNDLQKILGRIGEIKAGEYLGLPILGVNSDGSPDKGDIVQNGMAIDAKTSFSTVYRDRGIVPRKWGLLIPDSQFQFRSFDYYIRCAVDSHDPRMVTKLCFVGVCTKETVAELAEVEPWRCKQPIECTVMMRVVKELHTFSIRELKKRLEYSAAKA